LEQELASLYEQHAAGLLRYAQTVARDSAAAQDAVQEAYLRYFVVRAEGRPVQQPKPWLYRVLRNHLFDVRKASETRREVAIEHAGTATDPAQDPESRCRSSEASERLRRLLAPRELECVRLRAEGLAYSEIARVLSVRPGTVGAMLARAHDKARRIATDAAPRACALVSEEASCAH
jgi:RNA polymerase sigma-70 factor (ECF subfamily)